MRVILVGASLAFAGQAVAAPEASLERVMGRAFMPAVAIPQRVGHMSVHLERSAIPVQAPVTSLGHLQGEIFSLEENHDRVKAKLKRLRSRMVGRTPVFVQNWTDTMFGFRCFGYGIGAAFILSIIYRFFIKRNRGASVGMDLLERAELQSSVATALPLITSNVGSRTVGAVMSEGEVVGGGEVRRGRPVNARIELLQGPSDDKQVIELDNADGIERPNFCYFLPHRSGDVVRIVNTVPTEFPMTAAVVPYGQVFGNHTIRGSRSGVVNMLDEDGNVEVIPSPDAGGIPVRTLVLSFFVAVAIPSLLGDDELLGLVNNGATEQTDWFRILWDTWILQYSGNTLLSQVGIIKESPQASKVSLNDMECEITLNVGREPGTWMAEDWGASGARLNLPLRVRFSDEIVDMGFPGEEGILKNGGRYAKKLYCDGGSFITMQGETVVQAKGGAWAADETGIPGTSSLRFCIDFPEAVERNDVTLPAGRVFFTTACWESEEALPDKLSPVVEVVGSKDALGVVAGPGGVQLLDSGGLSIKKNGTRNLWGALGEVSYILGRFRLAVIGPPSALPSSIPPAASAAMESAALAAELPATVPSTGSDAATTPEARREALIAESEELDAQIKMLNSKLQQSEELPKDGAEGK